MKSLLIVMCAVCMAAGPATNPATKPATKPSTKPMRWEETDTCRKLSAQLLAANVAISAAREASDKTLAADAELAKLTKAAQNAKAECDRLRRDQAPLQDRLDAGSRANAAKKAADDRRNALISGDATLAAALSEKRSIENAIALGVSVYTERDAIALAEKTKRDKLRSEPLELKVGSVGRLPRAIKIETVVDGTNAIIRIRASRMEHTASGTSYVSGTDESDPVWLSGWDTTGKIDGGSYEAAGVFKISGTKTYRTVLGGSKTVLLIEPDDDK